MKFFETCFVDLAVAFRDLGERVEYHLARKP